MFKTKKKWKEAQIIICLREAVYFKWIKTVLKLFESQLYRLSFIALYKWKSVYSMVFLRKIYVVIS